jgi:hypothetical protein
VSPEVRLRTPGAAESKAAQIFNDFNAYSEYGADFDPNNLNRLPGDSEAKAAEKKRR